MNFENQVMLITGGTSGIGEATVDLAIQHGARVAVIGRNEEKLQQLASKYNKKTERLLPLTCDVKKTDSLQNAVNSCISIFGQLNVLVNAAGIYSPGSLAETTLEDWQQLIDINLTSVFNLMKIAMPYLEKTEGNIVNVSSVVGSRSFPNVLGYSVSKSALDQLTRCTAIEMAPKKVRINAVNPGVVITNLHRRGGMDEQAYEKFLEHGKTTHPIGRVGEPMDIAHAILYLASGEAGWVTGVTLNIDGGRHLTCFR